MTSKDGGTTLLLRGATVVDGTGASGRVADVRVESGRIVAVGSVDASSAEVIDLSGLVLAPGFIDNHTHYDAQVLWDRDLVPSSWHGVTSVIMGNCGYGVAPTRAGDREKIVLTLENVEGMSAEALRAGIDWSFESFPEYLDTIERGGTRLNVGAMVGHTALRYFVLGDEASERAATPAEVAAMADLLREALLAGALGFSTSGASVDNGAYGRPVPSRLAETEELLELVRVLGDVGLGVTQLLPSAAVELGQLADVSGRTVTYGAILSGMIPPDLTPTQAVDRVHEASGGRVVPQIACRPIRQQTTLADPFTLTMFSTAFIEALAVPRDDRRALYADPAWRRRVHRSFSGSRDRLAAAVVEETNRHQDLLGQRLGDLAAARGVDVLDLMIDLSIEDDLQTRFGITLLNDDEDVVAELLNDRRCLLALSDAGAHQSQICDAVFSSHLLGYWVREKEALPMELAVWRLTGHPAEVFGIADRGRIEPGAWADLVAFDPATVGVEPLERVHDLPAGADRLVGRSRGIEHVWVNGVAVRRLGVDLDGVRPGVVLRSR